MLRFEYLDKEGNVLVHGMEAFLAQPEKIDDAILATSGKLKFDPVSRSFRGLHSEVVQPLRAWCVRNGVQFSDASPELKRLLLKETPALCSGIGEISADHLKAEGVPDVLADNLLDYQRSAVYAMLGRKVTMLCDDMGLGKTREATAAAIAHGGLVLVICLKSVIGGWVEELEKWLGEGSTGTRYIGANQKACVVTYGEIMQPATMEVLSRYKWTTVICDESHKFCNADSKRTQQLVIHQRSILRRADFVVLATGTPQLARPAQLFYMFTLIWPETYPRGSFETFALRYCDGQERQFGHRKFFEARGATCQSEMRRLFRSVAIRRLQHQVNLRLPPLEHNSIEVELDKTSEAALAYQKVKGGADAAYEKYDTSNKQFLATRSAYHGQMARQALREMQLAATGARVATARWKASDTAFLGRVTHEVQKWLTDHPDENVLVFAHHEELRKAIFEALLGAKVSALHVAGDTPAKKRQEAINALKTLGGPTRVGVISTQAMGTGAQFAPGCTLVIFAEADWTPAVMNQAIARIHRLGCIRNVQVMYVKAKGTFDDKIYRMLQEKHRVNTGTLGDTHLDLLSRLGIMRFAEFCPTPEPSEGLEKYLQRVATPGFLSAAEIKLLQVGSSEDLSGPWINVVELDPDVSVSDGEAWTIADKVVFVRGTKKRKHGDSS